jgi:CarD family transcriptional regulator
VPKDFDNGTVIYAPSEGGSVLIRPIMTAEEAEALLGNFKMIPPLDVSNEKHRKEDYRNALKEGTPMAIVSILKTIYLRKTAEENAKKRISDMDMEFDKIVRRAFLSELSEALGIDAAEAEERLDRAFKE